MSERPRLNFPLIIAIVAASLAIVCINCAAADSTATAETAGIVKAKPEKGPAIEVDGGYMVPYTETIPGTDVTFEMIPVPAGEFLMGSPYSEAERNEDEGPQVRVKVEPFWIGKYEVTWAEYKSFMAMYDAFKKLQMLSTNRKGDDAANAEDWRVVELHAWNGKAEADWDVDAVTAPTPLYDSTFTYGPAGDEPNLPAVTVTPFAAKQYTKWLSGITGSDYRLPSEAEWEYAARAGTATAYSFGDDPAELPEYGWIEDNSDFQAHEVGSKKPNPWGLYDMHGNVGELTLDQYVPDIYAKLAGKTAHAKDIVQWPTKIYPRVVRGGSWYETAPAARSAARQRTEEQDWKLSDPNIPRSPWWYTEEPATAVGLRVVRPLAPLSQEEKKRVWEAEVDDLRQDVRDRLREGRGAMGKAGPGLPEALKAAEELNGAAR